MSIETFSPIPLETFGSWLTLLDPSDVPAGMSPNLSDVEFFPGGVRTRSGLVSQYSPLAGSPAVNGLKTYVTQNLNQILLAFDALGNLWEEETPGALSLISSSLVPATLMASTTLFGREYIGLSDGHVGQDLPRQFDATNLDRVSQVGPGEGPAVTDSSDPGSISAGVHQCVVVFVTRQDYWTVPSPAVSWTAAGGQKANVTDIPTGPSNVTQRLLGFTAAGGTDFFSVPATMVINDNTTTSIEVDFSDSILLSGTSFTELFGQIELPNQAGVIDYNSRLFWWGERAEMPNWRNLTFDGGWDSSADGRPLGWTLDPTFGAGGSRESVDVVWGDAYRLTADGATATRGLISQLGVTDADGNALIARNTDYSVRARIKRSAGLTQGILRINCFSPTMGAIGTGMAVSATEAPTEYVEFVSELVPPQTTIPSDLILRIYADTVPAPSGEYFLIDQIEIFLTDAAQNSSVVRASRADDPESYDGVTGLLEIASNNGQAIRCAFKLRNLLYFVKERSLYVTADDGVDEPALWSIEEVSNQVGTSSVHGVGFGEEWVVIAGRSGLYFFDGGTPQKLSQEIQPTWDSINWQYGHRMWVNVDTQQKRILVGVPLGANTVPSQILVLDYTQSLQDPLSSAAARKWAPWSVAANSCGLIERPTGVGQIFLGNNVGNGKIYGLTKGQYSDDGAAINSYYSTAFLSRTGASARDLFGYLTSYVQGSGSLAISASLPGSVTSVSLGSWPLSAPATEDMEAYSNIVAERVSYQFGTDAAGSWFSVTKFVPWAKPDPWAPVRGHN
jgi:hypothetical protein